MDEIGTVRPIPQEKYDLVVWTEFEKLFRDRPKLRNEELAKTEVAFTLALHVKLRRSVLGTYLKYFNEGQWQTEFLNNNKLTITQTTIEDFNQKKADVFEYNNNLLDEMMTFLRSTVTETEEIDCNFLHNNVWHLRLDDYNVSAVDDGLRNFRNLQFLILCGNWISDIEGSVLPRNLTFLELYANEIDSVKNLVKKAPKHLLHLGLGRNKLSDDSCLHLLAESGRFKSLKTLDLSECDIYRLKNVLENIAGLQNLEGLLLQGNPCSVVMNYKDVTLNNFPNLIYLDGSEITKTDRQLNDNLEGADCADLLFLCPELSGLPKPPKAEKNVKQTIHMEVILPLFQKDVTEEIDDVELIFDCTEKLKKVKRDDSMEKSTGRLKSERKKEKKSPYDKENEYNPKLKNNAFATERKPWSNNLTFSPIVLKSPENNLYAYRDSFRSCVNVRVVYLKFRPPEKKKLSKKGKKIPKKKQAKKKDSKKDKNLKKSKGKKSVSDKSSKADTETENEIKRDEPQETILKRVTLVNFYCDLLSINWKDDELNFCWFEESEFGDKAVEYKSYLEDQQKKEEEAMRVQLEEMRKKEEKQKKDEEKKKSGKSSKDKKGKKSNKTSKSSKSKKSKSKKTKKSVSSKSSKKGKPVSCLVSFGYSRIGKDIKIAPSKNKMQSKGRKKGKKKEKKKGKKKK